ncbi:MAG TPA: lipocalin-like domain-containing protein [Blastocatellia bacterium]|nr:lipocalin-like domain-containing protein [Blastocatellia bacterium]
MKNELIGSWKLVSAVYERNGRIAYPFGKDPIGLLVYDNVGNMTVQIMQRNYAVISSPRMQASKAGRAAFDGYLGYFGTYEINEAERIVMHRVLGSTLAHWVGTLQIRAYEFESGQLKLSTTATTDEEKGAIAVLVWERIT